MEMFKKFFLNPPGAYRDMALWSWNDDLDRNELVRQVDEFKEKGYGGFFIFSFYGLITKYLSGDWMECVRAVTERAGEIGLEAWIYDEDKFPSGHAGGMVVKKSEEFRICLLECREDASESEEVDREIVFRWQDGKENCKFVLVRGPDHPFYNYSTYIDTLNPKAVETFLDITHEAYYRQFRQDFSKRFAGFFADEFNMLNADGYSSDDRRTISWTPALPGIFRAKCGYDLIPNLPSLFFRTGDYRRIRYDYRRTVTELFVNTFTRKMYDWCDKHGVKLTGHIVYEDNLSRQTPYVGSAMAHYEYFHIPGGDHLSNDTVLDLSDALPDQDIPPLNLMPAIKQPASVAHQLGKERVFTEIYGASGWDLSFEDQKYLGDWDCVLGANFRSTHLSAYSLRGFRKTIYPPSLFFQQPWWKYSRLTTDHFARLNYVMSQGRYIADVLLLYPIESGWASYAPKDTEEIENLDRELNFLAETLLRLHCDYDYGDPGLMLKYGRIENRRLIIKEASYSTVIVPSGINLAAGTLSILEKFVDDGGTVIAIEPTPYLLDGCESEKIRNFFSDKRITLLPGDVQDNLVKSLSSLLCPDLTVTDDKEQNISELWSHHRQIDGNEIYFLLNTNRNEGFKAHIRINGTGSIEELDTVNGRISIISGKSENDMIEFELGFAPGQSHLIMINKSSDITAVAAENSGFTQIKDIKLQDGWRFERLDPNALVLDFCQYRINSGCWSETVPIWQADRKIKEFHGIEYENDPAFSAQMWKKHELYKNLEFDSGISIKYSFESDVADKNKTFFMALSSPDKYEIRINNQQVSYSDCGWWFGPCFKKIDISQLIRQGLNEVELNYAYRPETELDNCYIIGDFAVQQNAGKFRLMDEPLFFEDGTWTSRGYPFFAGTMKYSQRTNLTDVEDKRVSIKLDNAQTTATKIIINGKEAGVLSWHPYSLDITDYIKEGENIIELELTNSLRNLIGPHHYLPVHRGKKIGQVAPVIFADGNNWTDEYYFVQQGLPGKTHLIISKKFS